MVVLHRGDLLLFVAVLLARQKAPVDLQHHYRVGVTELMGNQLGRGACARLAYCIAVALVEESERLARIGMGIASGPAVKTGEQRRVWMQAADVVLDIRPRPRCHAHNSVARVRLGACRSDFFSPGIDIPSNES
jgi:hypothetical protein